MKKQTKRLLSLALAVIMILALMPVNAIIAMAAPTSMTLSAYPEKVAVGQTSALTVKDDAGAVIDPSAITFTSSNESVATVADGVVTGVHSGTATITATYTGTTVAATLDITVTATSTYNFSIKSFNLGNDTDTVAGADVFADTSNAYTVNVKAEHLDTWTDKNAAYHLPFFSDANDTDKKGAISTHVYYRTSSSVYQWHYAPLSFTGPMESYDYQNLNNTAPWRIKTGAISGVSNDVYVMNNQFRYWLSSTSGAYVTLILNVPAAGTYEVAATTGDYAAYQNMDFYVRPVDGTNLVNDTAENFKILSEFGSLGTVNDTDLNTTTTLTNKFVAEAAGEYYFTIGYSATDSARAFYSGIKSISLTMEEWSEPAVNADTTRMLVGGTSKLSVAQTSTFGNSSTVADVTYTAEGDAIYLAENGDGTAKVTAVAEGTATVTAKYTYNGNEYTDTVTFTVGKQLYINLSTTAFNFGNLASDGTVSISTNDTWTDPNASAFIPWDGAGNAVVNNGYGWDRGSTGFYYRLMSNSAYKNLNPTYQNFANTHPWEFTSLFSGLKSSTDSYMNSLADWGIYLVHTSSSYTEGNEPYFTLKFDIPKAGKYTVDVNAGVTGSSDHEYYMVPAELVSSNDRATLTKSDYYVGSLAASTTKTGSFTTTLEAGTYYFVCKMTGSFGNSKLRSVTFTPDVLSAAEVSAPATNSMGLGQTAQISVSQEGTLSGVTAITNATYESSDATIVRVLNKNGVATVTACGEGTANVTVKYTDLFGIARTAVVSYTVTASNAEEQYYLFSETAFNIANDTDGNGTYDDFFGQSDTTASKYIGWVSSGYGQNGTARKVSATHVMLYPWLGDTSNYVNPDYQNTNVTDPWTWMTGTGYWGGLSQTSSSTYMQIGYSWIYHGAITDGSEPYVTFKLDVAEAGQYNISVDTGNKSTKNIYFYMVPADEVTTANRASLCNDSYKLGSVDNSAGETTKTFTKYSADEASNGISLNAGSYYFVVMADTDTETSKANTAAAYFFMKSVTLTPVVASADTFTVNQQGVLGDVIQMVFTANASGYKIAGFDVYLNDVKLGNAPVETGVDTSISVSLSASQLSDVIKLQAVDGAGNAIGEAKSYTLADYLQAIIDGNYGEKMTELAMRTYNYCAYAQKHFGTAPEEGWKVQEVTGNAEIAVLDSFSPISGSTTGITAKSATLQLKGKISVRYYFSITEGVIEDYTFKCGENVLEPVQSGNRYYVEVADINPQDYDKDVIVTVTNGDEGSLTVTYSPMDYIQRTYHKAGTTEDLKNLLQAMYDYHLAAKAL